MIERLAGILSRLSSIANLILN